MDFKISDKVVCIAAHPPNGCRCYPCDIKKPVVGEVYVVRDVWMSDTAIEGWLIQMVGFEEDIHSLTGKRRGFTPSRFRKLDDIKAENAVRVEEKVFA